MSARTDCAAYWELGYKEIVNRVLKVIFALLITIAPQAANPTDLSSVDAGVPRFFEIFREGGLEGVEDAVLSAYKDYDLDHDVDFLQKKLRASIWRHIFSTKILMGTSETKCCTTIFGIQVQ